ncbi:MAG: tetratricopeptide repeat protein [Betaproteobacteria bacterium]
MRAPLWLALDRHIGQQDADAARRAVLAGLNERRGALETVFRRPLLLLLPSDYAPLVWKFAPDLWTIRGFVGELADSPDAVVVGEGQIVIAGPNVEGKGEVRLPPDATERAPSFDEAVFAFGTERNRLPDLGAADASAPPGRAAIAEWQRIAAKGESDPGAVSPWLAISATEQALAAGHLGLAAQIARQGLDLARARAEVGNDEAQRDLLVALDNVARVAQAQSDWPRVEALYHETMEIGRQLAQRLGTPQAQRDLSVALNNVGQVAEAQADWPQAEAPYRESLELRRQLAQRLNTTDAQRDLSLALNNVGRVAQAQGDWARAEALYRESLEIGRQLAQQLGTPQAQRDLSLALSHSRIHN